MQNVLACGGCRFDVAPLLGPASCSVSQGFGQGASDGIQVENKISGKIVMIQIVVFCKDGATKGEAGVALSESWQM